MRKVSTVDPNQKELKQLRFSSNEQDPRERHRDATWVNDNSNKDGSPKKRAEWKKRWDETM